MPERLIQEFKTKTKKVVAIMFGFLVIGNVIGLYAVQERAKDYAAKEATKALLIQNKKDNAQDKYNIAIQKYNTNKQACGIKKIIDQPGRIKNRDLAKAAAEDKTLSEDQHQRAVIRYNAAKKAIKDGKIVLNLFEPIPTDFDCDNLPANPPVAPPE